MSKGETAIYEQLEHIKSRVSGFTFEHSKRLPHLKYKLSLVCDFVVKHPDIGTGIMEYDGEQHFGPTRVDWKEQFSERFNRDLAKNRFAVKNKFHFLRIAYTCPLNKIAEQIDKFIEEALRSTRKGECLFMVTDPELYFKLQRNFCHLVDEQALLREEKRTKEQKQEQLGIKQIVETEQ